LKIGLVLSGGGAKGMAHIGALCVLEVARISIDLLVGTSAGAIIGALYAAGKSSDDIERLMRRLNVRQWFAFDRTGMGMFSTDGIRRIISAEIGKDTRIQDLPRAFACVAVDLDSRQEVIFDSGPVADAVCASAAFPGIFAPVQIAGRFLVDGGVLNPVPFDVARRMGANRVIAIDLGAPEPFSTPNTTRRSELLLRFLSAAARQKTFFVIGRSVGIMTQKMREEKLAQSPPDLIVYPAVQEIGLLDLDLVDFCLAAGEAAARDALPQIEKIITPPRWWNRHTVWARLQSAARRVIDF
jgi:NTE family protein